MKVLRLHLEDYRIFESADLRFSPGLNLVRGPNESGKSTVVGGLVACLFEKPGAGKASVKAARRWGVEHSPVLVIEFEHEGSTYRLVKDFEARDILLEELGGGKRLDTVKAVESAVADFIGFADSAHYLRTACVTHDQMVTLAEDSTGARKLAAMLREVVVGCDETGPVDAAIKRLSAEVDELRRGLEHPAKNPGTIKRLQDEKDEALTRQKELSSRASDIEGTRLRLGEIEGELAEKEPRLADLDALLEKNRSAGDIESRLADARGRFGEAERAREAQAELERVDRDTERQFPGFDELGPDADLEVRNVTGLSASLKSLRDEVTEGAEKAGAGRREGTRAGAGWALVGVGLLIAILGVGLGFASGALFWLIAPGAAILCAGVYLVASARGREGELPVGFDEDHARRTDEKIRVLEDREKEFLARAGYDDPEAFLRAYETYKEQVSKRKQAAAAVGALLGRRTMGQVLEGREKAALEASALEAKLSGLAPYRIGPERIAALERERSALSAEVEALKKEKDGLSFHLEKASDAPEEALSLEEKVAWLWDEEQRAKRRLRVYGLALEGLEKARQSMLSSAVPVLEQGVGLTFARLTGGRYDRVGIDEGDLGICVYSSEKGEMIPAEELLSSLSKGTVSQLYLSARLQMVELLSGGRKPPLIFDDSFSYFDEGRLERLWQMLLDTAVEQQVIVLTCTGRYDHLLGSGVNLIEL